MAALIRRLPSLPDNLHFGSLADRVVACIGVADDDLVEAVLSAGAKQCLVTEEISPHFGAEPRVAQIGVKQVETPKADIVLIDIGRHAGTDYAATLVEVLGVAKNILAVGGVVFTVLKSGYVNSGFDVYNPIVRTQQSTLPSSDYLIQGLLSDWTVRILQWLPQPAPGETARLFRLSVKRQTLLLIIGRSHSGKTTLARDFLNLDRFMHVSNDYIYCELVARHRDGAGYVPAHVAAALGDGSGRACGEFNRALGKDADLLSSYLDLMIPLIPKDRRLISVDFDLAGADQLGVAKTKLTEAGYSVWIVSR